jgi:hypothetical protein
MNDTQESRKAFRDVTPEYFWLFSPQSIAQIAESSSADEIRTRLREEMELTSLLAGYYTVGYEKSVLGYGPNGSERDIDAKHVLLQTSSIIDIDPEEFLNGRIVDLKDSLRARLISTLKAVSASQSRHRT